jgi:hypothetical protein
MFFFLLTNKEVTQRYSSKPHCVVRLEWNSGNSSGGCCETNLIYEQCGKSKVVSPAIMTKIVIHCHPDFYCSFSDMLGL